MIREIVEQSANPACLEAKLRSLGEKHLTVDVSKAFYNRESGLFGTHRQARILGRTTALLQFLSPYFL